MLVIKAYIGGGSVLRQIDEIHIQNVTEGELHEIGTHDYLIRKPNLELSPIKHKREKGYMPLAIKAMKIILKEELWNTKRNLKSWDLKRNG